MVADQDPLDSFIGNMAEKIKLAKEHKDIMQAVQASAGTNIVENQQDPFANLMQKIGDTIVSKLPPKELSVAVETTINEQQDATIVLANKIKQALEQAKMQQSADTAETESIELETEPEVAMTDVVIPVEEVQPEEPVDTDINTKALAQKIRDAIESAKNKALNKVADVPSEQNEEPAAKEPEEPADKQIASYIDELKKIKDTGTVKQKEEANTTLKELKEYIDKTVQDYSRRILDLGGGGGSVAVQYANGGVMNGNLNINGHILSGGRDISNYFGSGGGGGSQTLSFNASNADLSISGGNTVSLASLSGGSSGGPFVKLSGDTMTGALSAPALSADIIYARDIALVNLSEPDVTTPNNKLQTTSITVQGNDLTAGAGGQVPSTVIKGTTFFGKADGSLGILANSHNVWGPYTFEYAGVNFNITQYNNIYFTAGYFPQLWLDTSGNVGIHTAYPSEKLDVNGNIKATGGDSTQWNSNWTVTNSNSANWSSVYTSMTSNSAKYDSVWTTTNNNSANWSAAYTNLVSNSSNYLSGASVSYVNANFVKLSGDTMTGVLSVGAGGNLFSPSFATFVKNSSYTVLSSTLTNNSDYFNSKGTFASPGGYIIKGHAPDYISSVQNLPGYGVYGMWLQNVDSMDPGNTFISDGRAQVTHAMSFRAGINNFTAASDHNHVQWQGAPSNPVQNWQMTNGGSTNVYGFTNNNNYTQRFLVHTLPQYQIATTIAAVSGYFDTTNAALKTGTDRLSGVVIIVNTAAGAGNYGLITPGAVVGVTLNPGLVGLVAVTYNSQCTQVSANPTNTLSAFKFDFFIGNGNNWVPAYKGIQAVNLQSRANGGNPGVNLITSQIGTNPSTEYVGLTGCYRNMPKHVLARFTSSSILAGYKPGSPLTLWIPPDMPSASPIGQDFITSDKISTFATGTFPTGVRVGYFDAYVVNMSGTDMEFALCNLMDSYGFENRTWPFSAAGNAGWVLYGGTQDTVHRPTFGTTGFYFEREPWYFDGTNYLSGGMIKNVSLGNSESYGNYSYGLGFRGAVLGDKSGTFAGDYNAIYSNNSVALGGEGLISLSSTPYQAVVGKYNNPNNNALFVVGAGISNTNRVNVLEVNNNGLTVTGSLSTSSTMFASGGNSNQWNSNYTTTNTNSANWSSVYTSFSTNSGKYDSNWTTVNTNSGKWDSNWTTVNSNSANWILDGGNTKGANISIGTNDNYNLALEINNNSKLLLTSDTLSGNSNKTSFGAGSATSLYSFAEGSGRAFGVYSHAEGDTTTASGPYSHTEGQLTRASGYGSHAEGAGALASGGSCHAEGNYTSATANASHAEGDFTLASGYASHTEGQYTSASDAFGHAEGQFTKASGYASHAQGQYTIASGVYSHAQGQNTKATVYADHAEGLNTEATGGVSHAEGQNTKASGNISHAEGYLTEASGSISHAQGQSTKASGYASHAEGASTIASGTNSHAQGDRAVASGYASHAEGQLTAAKGTASHAAGSYAEAIHDRAWIWKGSTVTNVLSTTRTDQFLVSAAGGICFSGNVGIGTDDNTNALTVNGAISSNKAITVLGGNSNQWNSAYSTTQTNSATWSNTYTLTATNFIVTQPSNWAVNTLSNGVTATLPSSPSTGTTIGFLDASKTWAVNNFVLLRNGQTIESVAENLNCDISGFSFSLTYVGGSIGWRVY
jgi:hypothetical protein